MKKKFLALLSFAMVFLTACSAFTLEGGMTRDEFYAQDTNQGATQAGVSEVIKTPEEIKIGLSLSTLNNPFFVSIQDGVSEIASEQGSEVISVDAQDDSAKQQNDVNDLIQQGVDILLINPVDSAAIVPAVQSANAAGIPVVTLDRASEGGEVVTLVASDNVTGGEMAAEYIIELAGENANVVQLEGVPGASATNERGEGFENIANTSLNVLDSQTANFNRAEGLSVMEDILQSNEGIQGVFAQNDEMALGAIEAITAAGLLDDIVVVGFDGTDDGIDSVNSGKLAATIAQQPKEMGRIAVDTIYAYFRGEQLPTLVSSPLELIGQ